VILADPSTDEDTFELLNGIAPTVVPTSELGAPWQDLSRFYASALGKDAEIEQVLADVDQRIQQLRTELGENEGASVVVLRWLPNGPMVMSAQTITGQLLQALGFALPPMALELEGVGHSDVLSLENLSEIDVDWIFVATLDAEGEDALATAMSETAFQQLPAAQAGHVVAVNGQLWSSTSGPLAADAILDDIEAAMDGESA
jgi:iron complex transport system substrate-binding protein